jgi:hypothetical protein
VQQFPKVMDYPKNYILRWEAEISRYFVL